LKREFIFGGNMNLNMMKRKTTNVILAGNIPYVLELIRLNTFDFLRPLASILIRFIEII